MIDDNNYNQTENDYAGRLNGMRNLDENADEFEQGFESVDGITDDEAELEDILEHESGMADDEIGHERYELAEEKCEFGSDFYGDGSFAGAGGIGLAGLGGLLIAQNLENNKNGNAIGGLFGLSDEFSADELENRRNRDFECAEDFDFDSELNTPYHNLSDYTMIPDDDEDIVSGSDS